MKRLYFDTETTGFPAKTGAPLTECPYIVQLAAILVDDDDGEILALNAIIKPDGWTVPDGAAEVHGISAEKAERYGIPASVIIPAFGRMADLAEEIVATTSSSTSNSPPMSSSATGTSRSSGPALTSAR